jgi:hypothetical protein
LVLLLTARVPLSQHLRPLLQQIAVAHPETKFLSIPAGMCIANYPDKNVPTLLIYRNGDMLGNLVAGAGLNGLKTTVRGECGMQNEARGWRWWGGRLRLRPTDEQMVGRATEECGEGRKHVGHG